MKTRSFLILIVLFALAVGFSAGYYTAMAETAAFIRENL